MASETVDEVVKADTGTVEKAGQVDSAPDTQSEPEATTPNEIPRIKRDRNYSFLHKKESAMDEVEVDGVKYRIPAHVGSSYWAILRVMYERANRPVYPDELFAEVAKVCEDRDPEAWQAYVNKDKTTVYLKGKKEVCKKPAKPWKERIFGNTVTLTRRGGKSPYGMRLHERGHGLRQRHDASMQKYFILYTDTAKLKADDAAEKGEPEQVAAS